MSKTPEIDDGWWMRSSVGEQYASECQRLSIDLGELRAEIFDLVTTCVRSAEHSQTALDLMKRCHAHDLAFANLAKALPTYFHATEVGWGDRVSAEGLKHAAVFPGRVDLYRDLWVCSVWNMLRCSRIILNCLITRCTAWLSHPLDYRTTREYTTAVSISRSNVNDIIASIPYQIRQTSKLEDLFGQDDLPLNAGVITSGPPRALGGYLAAWPLALVQNLDYTTDFERKWAQGRLEYIGSRLGVRYAHAINQVRLPHMLLPH